MEDVSERVIRVHTRHKRTNERVPFVSKQRVRYVVQWIKSMREVRV
jgi:hypothetical protein